MATLFLVFWGTSMLFSLVAAPTYIPTNNVGMFFFLHTFFSIYCLWTFNDGHSDLCEVIAYCSFDLHFSISQRSWAVLLAICMSSLETCLFKPSVHFLIWFCFLLSHMSGLYILQIKPLSGLIVCVFSTSLPVVLLFVTASFAVQKLTSLIRSHLFILAFISISLRDWTKKMLLWFM